MAVAPRLRARDPLRAPIGERRAAIERGGDLHAHPGAAARHARYEADVQLAGFFFEQPVLELDSRGGERLTAASGLRIGIAHRHHDTLHLRLPERLHARRRAPMVVARLEVDVDRGALGIDAGKRRHLGVRSARSLVPAFADDALAAGHDAADARIGRGAVQAALGEGERAAHHRVVESGERSHLRRLRGDFTSCTASRKSSGVSNWR